MIDFQKIHNDVLAKTGLNVDDDDRGHIKINGFGVLPNGDYVATLGGK